MNGIRRTLGELKNKVIDAEEKDFGTNYQVWIPFTDEEETTINRDAMEELVGAIAKKMAEENDLSNDFNDTTWDNFYDRICMWFIHYDEVNKLTSSAYHCEGFLRELEEQVDQILRELQTKIYEVEVCVTFKNCVTIPVKARSEDEAEDYVNNMDYDDIKEYFDDTPDIEGIDVTTVDESDYEASDFDAYEDATE